MGEYSEYSDYCEYSEYNEYSGYSDYCEYFDQAIYFFRNNVGFFICSHICTFRLTNCIS